jgi:hypothetical protein
MFDLLLACPLLVEQVGRGSVGFGINHEMSDFKMRRKKNLDLVLCRPASDDEPPTTFQSFVKQYGIRLDKKEKAALESLPDVHRRTVGAVHLALEAKATMTAHSKARPRLYDELNSSHLTIHGNADIAIAAGIVIVNVAETFISPDLNKTPGDRSVVSEHSQPRDAEALMNKVREIPRRTKTGEEGFDAIAIVVVDCANDGSPVRLIERRPAVPKNDVFHYESMIHRVVQLYETRFQSV